MNGCKTVRFDVQGKWSLVDGDVEHLLMPLLTSTRSRFVPTDAGFERRFRRESFCRRARSGKLVVPTGTVRDIRNALEKIGYEVVVEGRMFETPLVPSTGIAVSPGGQQLLDALGNQPSGVLEPPGRDAIGSIALICRAYSKLRILIAVASRQQVRWLHRELRRQLGSTVRTADAATWDGEGGQLVATDHPLEHANPLDWDLIVLPTADQLGRRQRFPGQALLLKRPVLGLVSNWAGLGMRERLRLQLLCGPLLYRDGETTQADAVQVLWCLPPVPTRVSPQPGLERKRQGWWHNRERNELIAEVASALAAGDLEALWQHGLLLDQAKPLGTHRTTILVESPEHGRELLGLLAGWRLATANDEQPEQSDRLDRTIVTTLAACRLGKFQTDVLVRADGGEGTAALNSLTGHQSCFATLVDFADDFDAAAQRATSERARSYRSRGWTEQGTPGCLKTMNGVPSNEPCDC